MRVPIKTSKYVREFWLTIRFAITNAWHVSPGLLLLQIGTTTLQASMPILLAYLSGRLIDMIVRFVADTSLSARPIFILLIVLTVVRVLYSMLSSLEYYLDQIRSTRFEEYFGVQIHEKLVSLDHSFYEGAEFNKHYNKVKENLNKIISLPSHIFRMFSAVVQLVIAGITLTILSPLISFVLIAGNIPLMRVLMKLARARWGIWDRIDAQWRLRYHIQWYIRDIRGLSEVKIYGLAGYLNQLWRKYFNLSEQAQLQVEKEYEKKQVFAELLAGATRLGVDIWLLVRVLARESFTIGNFEFYRQVVSNFSDASNGFVVALQNTSERALFVKDYQDLMALQPKVVPPLKPKPIKSPIPQIEFRDVSFSYPKSNEPVIKHLSLTIQPGEDVAFVGENGAGKTTLIKLLMRFYDVSDGAILIDGHNIRDIDLDQWYRKVGVLFQHFNHYQSFRVRRTIGVGDVSRMEHFSQIKAAAKEAQADIFIQKLDHAYDTVLNTEFEDGTELSGGQWQRIALARAFFRDAPILILDEPTSAIDAKAEYEIFERIRKVQKDKTTIIISHRFSTVRNAHMIYVIADGTISESGTHEELMQIKSGTYHKMFSLQAKGYR